MINFQDIQISPDTSVLEAMRIIDRGMAQIAFVVDDQQRLLGTLTDGDIRRALLEGKTLESSAEGLMNHQFRFVRSDDDHAEALKMMRREVLSQIPVLNSQGQIVNLLLLHDLIMPAQLPNAVVIMAGGKGTRLRPYTENCPKPMLLVDGKPILQIILEQCIDSGFRQFYFSVNYLKEQIIDYFGDGKTRGVSIKYIVENEPLGTAGSLQYLPSYLKEPILVMNGDVLTRFNPRQLLQFHMNNHAMATVGVREHITTVPFGVVQTDGVELAGFEEKPSYHQLVNAGLYFIAPQLLDFLSHHQPIDMPSLLQRSQQHGHRVVVCPIHEYWIDVGRPESLSTARDNWKLVEQDGAENITPNLSQSHPRL